jgi:hypothetical protein
MRVLAFAGSLIERYGELELLPTAGRLPVAA